MARPPRPLSAAELGDLLLPSGLTARLGRARIPARTRGRLHGKGVPTLKRHGILQALGSAALFGAATPVAKDLLGDLSPAVLAGLFYLGAAAFLAPFVLRGRLRGLQATLPADRRNRLLLLGAILFGGILGPVLLLSGLVLARAASVAMLLNLETTATALLAAFLFREHLGRAAWLGNAGVLGAGLLLSLEGGRPGMLGALLVAGAAVCWGLDNNLTALIDGITPTQSTFWKGLVAGTTTLTLGLILHPVSPSPAWLAALCVGGLSYGVSIVLYISSAQTLGATRSQMIFASAPFFGVALAVLWLGEGLTTAQAVAGGLLLLSLGLLFLERHDHDHEHAPTSHQHAHRHDDGHHDHTHPGQPGSLRHTHAHDHARQVHSHPHWPDLHHRHDHDGSTRRGS